MILELQYNWNNDFQNLNTDKEEKRKNNNTLSKQQESKPASYYKNYNLVK